LSTFAVIAGYSMQAGRRLNRQLRDQAELLQRTREERVRLAVSEERMRVARDMHDVVAHGVTVMVVQAGGARMVAAADPQLAAETLADVERIGAEAVRELSSLVGTLDPDSTGQEPDPHGEVPDVGALVERLRRTGQDISLVEEGEVHALDMGLQTSVYRIVQEALTNVRKHAPGARALVTIRYLPDRAEVEVGNDVAPPGRSSRVPGAGQGLLGIRERAAVFGGEAEAGPSPEGGFHVAVRLPVALVPA